MKKARPPSTLWLTPLTPQDSFQVKFWKLRQSEQEGYNVQYLPLRVRQVGG